MNAFVTDILKTGKCHNFVFYSINIFAVFNYKLKFKKCRHIKRLVFMHLLMTYIPGYLYYLLFRCIL